MQRVVEHELLDALPPADRQAAGSRADLRRLNLILGHADILARELAKNSFGSRTLRLVELGAGDGTFLLRVARRSAAHHVTVEATLVDRQNLVSVETRLALAALDWHVESVTADVLDWLEQSALASDVMFANLFLHHFSDESLSALLCLVAPKTDLFMACEPRRSPLALAASRLIGLIGCNAVTRHDAVLSVHAGFVGRELSALWPRGEQWQLTEWAAGLFSHCFVATRNG
jgi:hypothetical protein